MKYYNLFAAFEEFKEKLGEDTDFNELINELKLAESHNDYCSGSISSKVIDLDWVETIEKCLLDIDRAIHEQRRFIENIEEIVGIEKARRITSESVRHLAQHTNLISKVEDDTVTPEKILNIHREESFAVYENRFLYTLCSDLVRFIDKRFEALKEVADDSAFKFKLPRTLRKGGEIATIGLDFAFNSAKKEEELDLQADVSSLSDYQRVLRIKRIASDFLATPLLRQLRNCEPIKPPLVKTNVMKKNIHFINAADLYVYIHQYSRTGYTILAQEGDDLLNSSMKHELYNTIALSYFIVKISADGSLKKSLYEQHVREVERRRRALEEEEQLRTSKLNYLLEQARQEERKKYLDEVDRLNALLRGLQDKLNYYKMNYIRQTRTVNKLTLSLKRLAKKMDKEINYHQDLKGREIATLKKDWEDFVGHTKKMRDEQIAQIQLACRNQLKEQRDNYEISLAQIQKTHQQEVVQMQQHYQKQIDDLTQQIKTLKSKK
ncbi:MAG: hypothetical protein J6R37_02220 [Clostridia bacterium]|nr:hypothetical protein [Clostridia bacterium]